MSEAQASGYIDLERGDVHIAPRRGHVTLRFLPRRQSAVLAVPDSVDHESMACPQWEVVAVGRGRVDARGAEVPIEWAPGDIVCTATKIVGVVTYTKPRADGSRDVDRYMVMDEEFVLGRPTQVSLQ